MPDRLGRPAAPDPSGSALRRCVGDPAAFADGHWGAQPLLRSAGDFADLLDLDAVDELLSERGLRTPFLRLARDGKLVAAERFTGGGGLGAEIADQVRDDRVLDLLAGGATLVLQGLHRIWPPLRAFCLELAGELGCAVQANAYLTPAGNTGFATHYDTHDVFVLQIAGTKHWRVHEPVYPDPLERQPWGGRADEVAATATGPAYLDHVLSPGELLYLPRGWLHAASAIEATSLHVTLGLRRPTRYTVAQALLDLTGADPRLRAGLPLGLDLTDPAQLAPHLAATVEALHEAMAKADPEEVARRLRAAQWTAHRPAPVRPVAQAAFADALTAADRVRLRPGLRFTCVDGRLELPGRVLTFPGGCQRALEAVLAGPAVRVGDLPGLDDDASRLVLARRLLREAVLVPADEV
ncbi:cupin domain-containing protein [Catellatospora sp. KI3]|uniref:cupin domain-containing protein n=1 Tax=Catellatospora sp. KI3 TaxID=3041620 RepID=UPI0024827165|nr:cupin domain-containing protein [Catellatospora sp. KI3]MDI1466093.1 cupin domain-containing protein [Catellatospora sp. KI3]